MLTADYISKLIQKMEDLGYFKYSASKDIEEIKEDLWFGFKISQFNPTLDEVYFSIGKEKRYFMIDHLSIMDRDFVPYLLEEIETVLKNFNIIIEDLILPNTRNYPTKLCVAIDKINEILAQKTNNGEQFYIINKDDELGIILLTSPLQLIFESHFTDKDDIPLSTQDWEEYYFDK